MGAAITNCLFCGLLIWELPCGFVQQEGATVKVEFSVDEQEALKKKLMDYFADELQWDIGGFEAWFLIEYIINEIGPRCYKQGLHDAQAIMRERFANIMENVDEDLFQLEVNADSKK